LHTNQPTNTHELYMYGICMCLSVSKQFRNQLQTKKTRNTKKSTKQTKKT